ncbi:MAG: hypothetical protein QXX84_08960 [Sulfolobales archaeon]
MESLKVFKAIKSLEPGRAAEPPAPEVVSQQEVGVQPSPSEAPARSYQVIARALSLDPVAVLRACLSSEAARLWCEYIETLLSGSQGSVPLVPVPAELSQILERLVTVVPPGSLPDQLRRFLVERAVRRVVEGRVEAVLADIAGGRRKEAVGKAAEMLVAVVESVSRLGAPAGAAVDAVSKLLSQKVKVPVESLRPVVSEAIRAVREDPDVAGSKVVELFERRFKPAGGSDLAGEIRKVVESRAEPKQEMEREPYTRLPPRQQGG